MIPGGANEGFATLNNSFTVYSTRDIFSELRMRIYAHSLGLHKGSVTDDNQSYLARLNKETGASEYCEGSAENPDPGCTVSSTVYQKLHRVNSASSISSSASDNFHDTFMHDACDVGGFQHSNVNGSKSSRSRKLVLIHAQANLRISELEKAVKESKDLKNRLIREAGEEAHTAKQLNGIIRASEASLREANGNIRMIANTQGIQSVEYCKATIQRDFVHESKMDAVNLARQSKNRYVSLIEAAIREGERRTRIWMNATEMAARRQAFIVDGTSPSACISQGPTQPFEDQAALSSAKVAVFREQQLLAQEKKRVDELLHLARGLAIAD